jgi:hypothetical protein
MPIFKVKVPTRRFGSLAVLVTTWLLAPTVVRPAESGEFDPSSVLRSEPPVVAGTYAFDVERVFGTQTQMVRHEATKRQREVAEANARAFMAAQLHLQGIAAGPTKTKEDARKAQVAISKLPRYVAVDTVKDARSVPGTKKDVMVWDTRMASLVDNSVYDVTNPPAVGAIERFDTRTAEYIGNGLQLPEIAERPPEVAVTRH